MYKIKADAPTWPYGKESFIIFAGCRSCVDGWEMMLEHGQSEMHNRHPAQESRI